jgi:hypothetical protein
MSQHAPGRGHDPARVRELLETQCLDAEQRVARARDGADRLVRESLVGEVRLVGTREQAPDHDIDLVL